MTEPTDIQLMDKYFGLNTKPSHWYYNIFGQLVKQPKPCMPGNQVHIKNMNGCFTVHAVTMDHFVIMKNRQHYKIKWDQFQCRKGEGQHGIPSTRRIGELFAVWIKRNPKMKEHLLTDQVNAFINIYKLIEGQSRLRIIST